MRTQLFIKTQAEVIGFISWVKSKSVCTFMKSHNGLVVVIMDDNIYLDESELPSTKDV